MHMSPWTLIACTLLFVAAVARAEEPAKTPPPPPADTTDEESIQPEVTIIQHEDKTIEEYRINGRLYKIKVTPKVGPPYYLIDRTGNGTFTTIPAGSKLEPDIMIPQWVLFRW
jgi:hypothetical protein